MASDNKTAQVNLRLNPALKQAAEAAATTDHRSLTSLIEKLLMEYVQAQPTLEDWHNHTRSRFLQLLVEKNLTGPLATGTLTRSYRVRTASGDRLKPHTLTQTLHEVQSQIARLIDGPRLFYPYRNKPELIPYFTSDRDLVRGRAREILECALLPGTVSLADFWRVSTDGMATDVGQHFEDMPGFVDCGLEPGKWFCPFFMTRALAELVHHASLFAERFEGAETIEFRCEWSGLSEREVSDASQLHAFEWLPGKIAQSDGIVTVAECPARELRAQWDNVVSALGGATLRLFDPTFDYSPVWVQGQVERFKR